MLIAREGRFADLVATSSPRRSDRRPATGAMMATFAFLGPQYDDLLRKEGVGLKTSDLIRRRPILVFPFADAAYSARPLARAFDRLFTPELLCEVAKAHAEGIASLTESEKATLRRDTEHRKARG